MTTSIRVPLSRLCVSLWILVPLVLLLGGGCKPRKSRESMCVPTAIFEALEPERGAGAAPFSIERLGPEVESAAVNIALDDIVFTGDTSARIDWMLGDFSVYTEIAYSPAEGIARRVDRPQDVYPMRRFPDGKSERVRIGYRSKVCLELGKKEQYVYCKGERYSDDARFLVVDLSCQPK